MKKVKSSVKKKSAIVQESTICSETKDFQRLLSSGILKDFVSRNNGEWDHDKWLGLCENISMDGYAPIYFDQVGLVLEQEKKAYSA